MSAADDGVAGASHSGVIPRDSTRLAPSAGPPALSHWSVSKNTTVSPVVFVNVQPAARQVRAHKVPSLVIKSGDIFSSRPLQEGCEAVHVLGDNEDVPPASGEEPGALLPFTNPTSR